MRDLYIVQGIHFNRYSQPSDDKFQAISLNQKASRLISRELILSEGIERFFRDGVCANYAGSLNRFLRGEKKPIAIGSEYRGENQKAWLQMFKECQDEGANISYAETEEKLLLDAHGDFLRNGRGAEPDTSMINRTIEIYGKFVARKFLRIEMDKGLDKAIMYLRDLDVYHNVREHATATNLLWMGRAHELEEFYRRKGKKTGFKVATVVLEDDLSYNIRLANRDMPEGLPDLVERSIAKAKEQVQDELSDVA